MSTRTTPDKWSAPKVVSRVDINVWVGQEDGDGGIVAIIAGPVKCRAAKGSQILPVDIEGGIVPENFNFDSTISAQNW